MRSPTGRFERDAIESKSLEIESRSVRKITLITTGGTIEKTYDEHTGDLANRQSIVRRMLAELRLEETEVNVFELMSKDSLEMTDADRGRILEAVRAHGACEDGKTKGIVVLHGTDTLPLTGEYLEANLGGLRVPVVLTGAMRPFEMKQSDAFQNLTEAFFAAGVLSPGVYCVAHGRALAFPGVRKDTQHGTFVKA
jgi:L-asparaginase